MSSRRDRRLVLVGAVLLVLWLASEDAQALSPGGGAKAGHGSGRARVQTTRPKLGAQTGPGDVTVDVTSPKLRAPTAEELRKSEEGARLMRQRTTPPGTISASPELEQRHGRTPSGYNPEQARAQAPGIAAHLASKGPKAYSRNRLAEWQTVAALSADGKYGGSTRGALVYYGATKAPRPFVAPVATLPYHPPTA